MKHREAFEKFYSKKLGRSKYSDTFQRRGEGYEVGHTQRAWLAWLGGAEHVRLHSKPHSGMDNMKFNVLVRIGDAIEVLEAMSAKGIDTFDDFDSSALEVQLTINGVDVPIIGPMNFLQEQLDRIREEGRLQGMKDGLCKLRTLVDTLEEESCHSVEEDSHG